MKINKTVLIIGTLVVATLAQAPQSLDKPIILGKPIQAANPPKKENNEDARIMKLSNKLREMTKNLQKLKKREANLRKNIKQKTIRKKNLMAKKRVKKVQEQIDKQNTNFMNTLNKYTNTINNLEKRLNKQVENNKLSTEQKMNRIKNLRKRLNNNNQRLNKHKQRLKKATKQLNQKTRKVRKKMNQERKKMNNLLNKLKKRGRQEKKNQKMQKRRQEKMLKMDLRQTKQMLITLLEEKKKESPELFTPEKEKLIENSIPQAPQPEIAPVPKADFRDLMMCVNSYRSHIETMKFEISENSDLATSQFQEDSSCSKLNMDVGFSQGGCFKQLIENYINLNEDIKLFLDPSNFANFAEIITGIAQRAQELKSGVLDKCVNNEELQKRNPRCAQAIQSLFSEFRTEEGEGNFQAYMDISEDLNRLMNDDVWEEVQSECNK